MGAKKVAPPLLPPFLFLFLFQPPLRTCPSPVTVRDQSHHRWRYRLLTWTPLCVCSRAGCGSDCGGAGTVSPVPSYGFATACPVLPDGFATTCPLAYGGTGLAYGGTELAYGGTELAYGGPQVRKKEQLQLE
eukprot:2218784-Rhodomonas_salina.1